MITRFQDFKDLKRFREISIDSNTFQKISNNQNISLKNYQ